jgi:hypothetical protein
MTTPKNKYSKDGFELGASKIPIIVLGQNDFGSTREDIRKNFVEIRNNPDVIQLESKQNQNAKDRGNYLEDGIAHWVSDQLDNLCEESCSVSFHKPTDAFRLPKYKMAASLDGVLEVHCGSIQYEDPQTELTFNLSGKGVCEIKTQGYNDHVTYDHILQLQAQMLVSGFKWGVIGHLGPRLKMKMYVFLSLADIQKKIIERVEDFWRRVEKDTPYPIIAESEQKVFSDWSNDDKGLTKLCNDYDLAKDEIEKWTATKNEVGNAIKSILKQENARYVKIREKQIACELITRKATVEKIVPAKPASQYEKLTVKEISNE